MNVTEGVAQMKICPIRSTGIEHKCRASACMFWQWDQEMIDGPDSYVSEPGPTGHCGAIKGELK